jgi:YjbE family integral membrane protein
MLAALGNPDTWMALFEIAVINIVLSGDNAVVIALACRSLSPRDQKKAFIVGTAGIVVLMTALTSFAALLMTLPYIQIVGCVLLLWIGIKLLLPEDNDGNVRETGSFWEAVKTIIIADIVMSMDNVLGMAGAAKGPSGNAVPRAGDHDAADPVRQRVAHEAHGTLSVVRRHRRRAARLRRRRHGGR